MTRPDDTQPIPAVVDETFAAAEITSRGTRYLPRTPRWRRDELWAFGLLTLMIVLFVVFVSVTA